jgi:glycerol-3-phosphate dehydrogenase
MNQLFQEIQQHPVVVLMGIGYIGTALIATMPPKGEPFKFYDYAYDFLHLLLNTRQGSEMLQKFNIPAGTQVTQTVNPSQTTTTITHPQETK